MADVAEVVDRIAAQVHAHDAGLQRFKFFFATCVRVKDLHALVLARHSSGVCEDRANFAEDRDHARARLLIAPLLSPPA